MKKYLKAKMNEETSKRMEIGAPASGTACSNFVPCRRPALREAVQPAILNPPSSIVAFKIEM
jgi:hypothetical protein